MSLIPQNRRLLNSTPILVPDKKERQRNESCPFPNVLSTSSGRTHCADLPQIARTYHRSCRDTSIHIRRRTFQFDHFEKRTIIEMAQLRNTVANAQRQASAAGTVQSAFFLFSHVVGFFPPPSNRPFHPWRRHRYTKSIYQIDIVFVPPNKTSS